jgi:hypothetical protein
MSMSFELCHVSIGFYMFKELLIVPMVEGY